MACRHHNLIFDVASVSDVLVGVFIISFCILNLISIHSKSFLMLISNGVLCTVVHLRILLVVLKLKIRMALVL